LHLINEVVEQQAKALRIKPEYMVHEGVSISRLGYIVNVLFNILTYRLKIVGL
jgi:hypothetical protein